MGSRGKLVLELVEVLGGKAVPGKPSKLSSNKKDAAEQLLGLFDSLLGEQAVLGEASHAPCLTRC